MTDLDLPMARIVLNGLGAFDTLEAQTAYLAAALAQAQTEGSAELTRYKATRDAMQRLAVLLVDTRADNYIHVLERLEAWEKLMQWRRSFPPEVFYREISPNCNPIDPTPTLIAEWGTAPRGNDDGAMAIFATGDTFGDAALKLAHMLGLL